ncbi:pyruvate formate lyase family protein, partial [Chloroflexota bacterium]
MNSLGFWTDRFHGPRGRICVDYGKVLNKGLIGVIGEIEEQLARLPLGPLEALGKRDTLRAMVIACNAVIAFARRYASLAKEMADNETDKARKKELERISEACQWVPANPARTFYEAVQSFWFIHLVLEIDHVSAGISPGRLPQYMYPFYRADKEEGRITDEEAIELLELLFIKHTAICQYTKAQHFKESQGSLFQNIALGGVNSLGEDATTELDFLVLEAQKRVRMPQPTLSVLYHDKLSQEFLLKAAGVVRTGIGMPAFFNGNLNTQRLISQGASLEDARNQCIIGCVEVGFSHTAKSMLGSGINMPKYLEMALYNGKDPLSGMQIGLQTGNAETFKSYDELREAILKQFQYFFPLRMEISQLGYAVCAQCVPYPLTSALVDDCIEKGMEINAGGARYCMDGDGPVGITDLADSLAAVKKLIFEDKSVTMKELLKALKDNFEGHEELLRLLLGAPQYGNNIDYVDSIAREWYDIFWEEHRGFKDFLGNIQRPFAISVVWHSPFGAKTGALPSGRKAHGTLADGGGSASPGRDKNGPTALIKSVTKSIDCGRYAANLLNMKFHPSALATKEGLMKLIALIKSYMDLGGHHVQFNV